MIKIILILGFLAWPIILLTSIMMFPIGSYSNDMGRVLSVTAVLMYPIALAGIFWFTKGSLFGVSGQNVFIGTAIVVLFGIHLVGLTGKIFNLGKGVNPSGFTISEKKVFLDGDEIVGADPKSFTGFRSKISSGDRGLNHPYTKDNNQVFFEGKLVAGADSNSSKVLGEFQDWLVDEKSLFFKGNKLEGVNPNEYELLGDFHVKTPTLVYFKDQEIADVDIESFEILRGSISKDKDRIYIDGKQILKEAVALEFELYPNDDLLNSFGRDSKTLYDPYRNKAYKDIDINSLRAYERGYLSDKNAVYSKVSGDIKKLEGANPSTFVVTGWDNDTKSDANDGKLFFVNGKLVK